MNQAFEKFHRKLHFIGIAGTAMGSAACLAADAKFRVTGSDENIYPPMSDYLREKKIEIKTPYHPGNIPPDTDMVIIGNAISRGNPELEHVLSCRMHYISLSEFLKENIIRGNQSVVITGTHGKTTCTALSAHILTAGSFNPGYLIGGIPLNFSSNAHLPTPSKDGCFVIEGDEYDTAWFDKRSKFLHYLPNYALVNNIEFDHADIFSSLEEILLSFRRFVNLIPANGHLVLNADSENALLLRERAFCKTITFGGQNADVRVGNVRHTSQGTFFDISGQLINMKEVFLPMFGRFNVMNTAGVLSLILPFQIPESIIRQALVSFKGVRRRREIFFESNDYVFMEDFAHHPTAIKNTLESLKEQFEGRRIVAAFEPRSNTMVKNIFQNELANSLAQANYIFCTELYRKEKYFPQEILDLNVLQASLHAQGCNFEMLSKNNEVEQISNVIRPGDILILMSNGSFSGLKEKLLQKFSA